MKRIKISFIQIKSKSNEIGHNNTLDTVKDHKYWAKTALKDAFCSKCSINKVLSMNFSDGLAPIVVNIIMLV